MSGIVHYPTHIQINRRNKIFMIKSKNPTLLNVFYQAPNRGKGVKEYFEVLYIDDDGKTQLAYESPNVGIYIVKPEFRNYNYNKPQERIELMDEVTVPFSQIRRRIAEEIGDQGLNFVDHCYQVKEPRELDKLYSWPYAFKCDFQPEFYYMQEWYEKFPESNRKLSKAFIDIEIDTYDFVPNLDDLTHTSYAPVNCATIIFEDSKEVFTFVLRPIKPSKVNFGNENDYNNRLSLYQSQLQQQEKMKENLSQFIQDIKDEFTPVYGPLSYQVKFFDKEIDLIYQIFKVINDRKPNFCMAWNMRFDIQYLVERIKVLGYEVSSVICPPDLDNLRCHFSIDKSTYQLEKQYDFFYCKSYTQYICQMRLYAAIRKSQQQLKSIKLNAIADRELGDKKVEYPPESNMRTFPYQDFPLFIKYNIKDVLLQLGIERRTNDLMTYYSRSHTNLTPYNKIFRETHLLRNVREIYFEKEGWVQGNNINILNMRKQESEVNDDSEELSEKTTFKGALMADPVWNDYAGEIINGERSNSIFANAIDEDMKAFYPSIKIASNMDPGTLISKARIDNNDFKSGEFSNKSFNQEYDEKDKHGNLRSLDITGDIINTFTSGNILTFGYNYLNLPSVEEVYYSLKK